MPPAGFKPAILANEPLQTWTFRPRVHWSRLGKSLCAADESITWW